MANGSTGCDDECMADTAGGPVVVHQMIGESPALPATFPGGAR